MKYTVELTGTKAMVYTKHAETIDKIIEIVAENQMSRKQVEDTFRGIRKLLRVIPFLPESESLEIVLQ